MSERTCGTCVVCCVYPSINESTLKKDALKACEHLDNVPDPPRSQERGNTFDMPLFESEHYRGPSNANCTIYKNRPACCSHYRCAWIDGFGDEQDRPDKAGMVFDVYSPQGPLQYGLIGKPLWLGAEDKGKGMRATENISRSSGMPVLVLHFTESRLLRVAGRGVE